MNTKQKLRHRLYPLLMKINHITNTKTKKYSAMKSPVTSIYDLDVNLNDGTTISLSAFKGKKLMLINTASACGYTAQYAALQKLHETQHEKLQLIGFPSNDFGAQEQGSNEEIAAFCQANFGVTFPLAQKSSVKKGNDQNPVYHWLSNAAENGWNDAAPTWNFCKYIIDENGNLTHFFEAAVSPAEESLLSALDINA